MKARKKGTNKKPKDVKGGDGKGKDKGKSSSKGKGKAKPRTGTWQKPAGKG